MDGEFTSRHGGEWAQKISGYASFRAGILRPFSAVRGASYTAKVFGQLHIIGGGAVRIGIDPTGGTNPGAESVIWSPDYTVLAQWMEMTISGQALADTITVFLDAFSPFDDNTNAYFDDFELQTYVAPPSGPIYPDTSVGAAAPAGNVTAPVPYTAPAAAPVSAPALALTPTPIPFFSAPAVNSGS
jgi:hypothetical protein